MKSTLLIVFAFLSFWAFLLTPIAHEKTAIAKQNITRLQTVELQCEADRQKILQLKTTFQNLNK